MSKSNFIEKTFRISTDIPSIAITCIANIGSIICKTVFSDVAGNPIDKNINSIADIVFWISFSAILIQILINVFYIRKDVEKSDVPDCIKFPEDENKINDIILNECSSIKDRKIKIICYGTSMFGKTLEAIIKQDNYKTLEVVVCSPDANVVNNELDKGNLNATIVKLNGKKKVKVYISSIPPTIRACCIHDKKNKPIFCSFQPYFIFDSTPHFQGAKYTPTIITDTRNMKLLYNLTSIFEEEFKRLKESERN